MLIFLKGSISKVEWYNEKRDLTGSRVGKGINICVFV